MSAATPQACTAGFTTALIGRDIAAALAYLTDDVVFFYSNGSVIRGKDAFAALMTASWKIVENYRYATLESTWIGETDGAAAVISGSPTPPSGRRPRAAIWRSSTA